MNCTKTEITAHFFVHFLCTVLSKIYYGGTIKRDKIKLFEIAKLDM